MSSLLNHHCTFQKKKKTITVKTLTARNWSRPSTCYYRISFGHVHLVCHETKWSPTACSENWTTRREPSPQLSNPRVGKLTRGIIHTIWVFSAHFHFYFPQNFCYFRPKPWLSWKPNETLAIVPSLTVKKKKKKGNGKKRKRNKEKFRKSNSKFKVSKLGFQN